jgi:hypothetical protein
MKGEKKLSKTVFIWGACQILNYTLESTTVTSKVRISGR